MSILGETLEQITLHKAGIIKPYSYTVTFNQQRNILSIIEKICRERSSELFLTRVANFPSYKYIPLTIKINESLAIESCKLWMKHFNNKLVEEKINPSLEKASKTLYGRYQIIKSAECTYYLDGAHTVMSMKECCRWFLNNGVINSFLINILVINTSGDRNFISLIEPLKCINFDYIFIYDDMKYDHLNFKISETIRHFPLSKVSKLNYFQDIKNLSCFEEQFLRINVLITGSLYLVGDFLNFFNKLA